MQKVQTDKIKSRRARWNAIRHALSPCRLIYSEASVIILLEFMALIEARWYKAQLMTAIETSIRIYLWSKLAHYAFSSMSCTCRIPLERTAEYKSEVSKRQR